MALYLNAISSIASQTNTIYSMVATATVEDERVSCILMNINIILLYFCELKRIAILSSNRKCCPGFTVISLHRIQTYTNDI